MEDFIRKVKYIQNMEKYIAIKNGKLEKHNCKWMVNMPDLRKDVERNLFEL